MTGGAVPPGFVTLNVSVKHLEATDAGIPLASIAFMVGVVVTIPLSSRTVAVESVVGPAI